MKAVITTRYGKADGLQVQEIEKPVPARDEVLIRVHASTVTAGDVVMRRMPGPVAAILRLVMGFRRKRTPGHELAGVVEAVGTGADSYTGMMRANAERIAEGLSG